MSINSNINSIFQDRLNTLTLLAASGRLFDAITDPLIANLSDNWKGKRGRRIPFLMFGAVPTALFCVLMFFPIVDGISGWNIAWLFVMQVLFYVSLTVYVTPYFALLPELGHTANERLNLSTWISITYAIGIVMASMVPVAGGAVGGMLGIDDPTRVIQIGIGVLAVIAVFFMMIPPLFIEENRYCQGVPSDTPLMEALKRTFKNKSFIYYVVADFSYFMGLTIVMTGLLFYITVLLGLDKELMSLLLPLMVVVSFFFYPLVNLFARLVGKKILVTASFLFMGGIFSFIFFMGNLPIPETTQAYLVVILLAIPLSFLGVLPNAILADIAEHDALKTGIRQEGMFFAARTLMQKFGQTFGVLVFAALTSLGKDPGDDLGIRLSGVVGFALCIAAGIYFLKYNEKQVLQEIDDLNKKA